MKYIVGAIASVWLLYLGVSFSLWEMNPAHWSEAARSCFALETLPFAAVGALVVAICGTAKKAF